MNSSTYRDMHLLDELTHTSDVTQRELSRRIGTALGLTNLMLRRLAKKGYIKIIGTKRSRLRYLITPKGILEKSRLTYEYIQYSLQLYSRMRVFLRQQLATAAAAGHRRILLCGTGELAEIAFLTIHEMGLELTGIVDEPPLQRLHFLGHPVQGLDTVQVAAFDRVIVASLRWPDGGAARLASLGVSTDLLIMLPQSRLPQLATATAPEGDKAVQVAASAHPAAEYETVS